VPGFDTLQEIFDTLRRNRLRTLLTALSVAWGMFMLVVLLGAGHGLENGAAYEFRDDAVNSLFIYSGKTSVPFAGRGPGREVKFTNDDREAVASAFPSVDHSSGRFYLWGEFQVSYGAKHAAFDIRGTHPEHQYLEKTIIMAGRFLNDDDLREKRKVCVIGDRVRQFLFGKQDPLGEYVKIRGLTYKVIGVFDDVGGEQELRKIYLPITTAQLVYKAPNRIHQLLVTFGDASVEQSQTLAASAKRLLAERHSVSPSDRRAIRVQNNLEEFEKINRVFVWLRVFVWIVGVGTLFAGIVGISNIMLISVKERTKEIGLRKALGATPSSLVGLVLGESILVTSMAGYSGLVLGIGAVATAARFLHDVPYLREPRVDISLGLTATALLVVAGTLAGLFPALHAARVSPIVALRDG
jgi:putative ABC transport system permease protein